MIQLGISAFYHDAAACIVKDGVVIAAAEEERFTEIKHDSSFPINAIKWCLEYTNFKIQHIDEVCWYENPETKKDRVLKIFKKRPFRTFLLKRKFLKEFEVNNPKVLLEEIGYKGKIVFTEHHLSHAAFSFLTSQYDEAAILTVDGVGEWETITISHGDGTKIEKKLSIDFPNSLGMLYSTITAYLGFKPNEGEYKVMGLAPYGDPTNYFSKLDKIFTHTTNKFWIKQKYFTWEYSDKVMFNKKFFNLLKLPPRLPEDELTQEHKDLAAALQKIYEREFLKLVRTAKLITGSKNLCLGGGCAYNGVANSKAYKYFESIHIPFAPSDAGSAIGACLYNSKSKLLQNNSPYLGPDYSNNYILKLLKSYSSSIQYFKLSEQKLLEKTAEILNNQNIVAWFQGRMEFGARALGNRSILASPKDAKMREKLNYVIKKREGFRPFAPSVIEDSAYKYFHIKEPVPYMNQVVNAIDLDGFARFTRFPAATHVDNTCRVQTVNKNLNERYYKLLIELKRISGFPVVLNTSFNLKDQTITMTPKQAIERYLNSEIDYLVINNYLIKKI